MAAYTFQRSRRKVGRRKSASLNGREESGIKGAKKHEDEKTQTDMDGNPC